MLVKLPTMTLKMPLHMNNGNNKDNEKNPIEKRERIPRSPDLMPRSNNPSSHNAQPNYMTPIRNAKAQQIVRPVPKQKDIPVKIYVEPKIINSPQLKGLFINYRGA